MNAAIWRVAWLTALPTTLCSGGSLLTAAPDGDGRTSPTLAPVSKRPGRHCVVQQHLETWLAQCRKGRDDAWLVPQNVEPEFRRYLDCGILARGFIRACCAACGDDFLVAVSCQGRGVCPSYAAKQIHWWDNARRRVATAANLTDHVLPSGSKFAPQTMRHTFSSLRGS